MQVRTKLQHYWAELSEKLADSDPELKYGGGATDMRTVLHSLSKTIELIEKLPSGVSADAAVKESQANLIASMLRLGHTLEQMARERQKPE